MGSPSGSARAGLSERLISGWHVEVGRLALASLAAHKMRGALTILAIIIGITSVVGMVSLVEGVNRSLHQQSNLLEANRRCAQISLKLLKWPKMWVSPTLRLPQMAYY